MQKFRHTTVIKSFQKLGFKIVRQSKHVILQKNQITIAIPRHNEINPLIIRRLLKECSISISIFLDQL